MNRTAMLPRSESVFWVGCAFSCLGDAIFICLLVSGLLPAPISAVGERRYEPVADLMRACLDTSLLVMSITIAIAFMARRRLFTQIVFSNLSLLWLLYNIAAACFQLYTPNEKRAWTAREYTPWPDADSGLALYELVSVVVYLTILPSLIWRRPSLVKALIAIALAPSQWIVAWMYLFND